MLYIVSLSNHMPNEEDTPRPPLTRELILQAAVDLADREGLGALTMRRLGSELGVEAMSLYKHIANKEAILEGIVELVVGDIDIPSEGSSWKEAMRQRATSARQVLSRHSWAVGLLETLHSKGPATLRYINAILGNLRASGFSVEDSAHVFWLLDSHVYGQVIQEANLPLTTSEEMVESTETTLDNHTINEYPHLVELGEHAMSHRYSVDDEFEFGLDLILDAVERTMSYTAH